VVDVERGVAWAAGALGPITDVTELSGGWTSTMLALTAASGERAVLRLMTVEPWRTHGEGLTSRESRVQCELETTRVPAPRSLALDASGAECGHPAHLMSLLPGSVDLERTDPGSLAALVHTLAAIHAVTPTIEVRDYQSWAWEAKFVVPPWSGTPALWRDAFEVLRSPAPAYEPCLIHRDFHPRNVLWSGDAITGVVDWVETSMGPAWLDVARCSSNLALLHGPEEGAELARAYTELTGVEPAPYFDVMDIVGFLPPPGETGLFTDEQQLRRLEDRLRVVMGSL
jgi:aminoglycoside phosphotransferase (APT) family kinase protein